MLELAHLADPSAEAETPGLVPSAPSLRPADVLTSAALPGRLAALDVGVVSPDAAGSGPDCCAHMFEQKMKVYREHFEEMEAGGVIYRPLIWSALGREHPETSVVLEALARAAARRRGLRDFRQLLRRTRDAIGVMLTRRAVRMVWACLDAGDTRDLDSLVAGRGPLGPCQRTVELVAGMASAS